MTAEVSGSGFRAEVQSTWSVTQEALPFANSLFSNAFSVEFW